MKFFYDLSTKTKLLVCFTIVIAINLIISITTLTSLNQVNKAAEEIDGVLNAAFSRTFTVQEALEKTQFSFSTGLNMLYFDYDEKMLERDAPQLIADIKTRINALNPDFLGTQEYRDLCLEVKQAALNSVKILEERVMPKIQRDAFSDANSTFTTEVYPELARAISACSALYKIQTQHCLSLTQAASDSTIVFVDSILTVVGVIMALICAFFMSNYIARALKEQTDVLNTLATGNFSEHIKGGYADEFGKSHDIIRKTRDSLGTIINMTKDECAKLQGEMRNLQDISHNFANMASDIQNQAVTVAAAANQMVSTTQDIARNCETAAAGSTRCKEISSTGLDTVQQAIDNIRQQSVHTRDNAAKIESLAKQTNDIGSIVSTIDDIAAQTNLLALNAAIEAARAGEAGRGFAVVADEVRALASRTTASTQEISQMVKNVQAEAKNATDSINASVVNMDTVANDASHIMDIFNDISAHVSDVNTQITQIATAAEEQTTATSEISAHMQNVSQMTGDMAQDADHQYKSMDSAYNDLSALAQALSFFKTRANQRDPQPHA